MDRKPIEFRLTPGDISAIRFGLSPGMELAGAVRTLVDPSQHPLHWGWVRGLRGGVPAEALELLGVLVGSVGYLPDFLTSTPGWDLTPDVELARLRDTHLDGVRRDLHKVVVRSSGRRRALVEQLAANPARTRAAVADAWEEVWGALLESQWPTLERLLRADVSSRARRISEHGLAAMVGTLHDQVTWRDDVVEVRIPTHSQTIDCTGTGLMLVPSVFRRTCGAVGDAPAHPMLFYPAHGISETWHEQGVDDGTALATLLGEGRARVLTSLDEPLSTTETAQACDLAISTASHHLTVLRNAALVDSRRNATWCSTPEPRSATPSSPHPPAAAPRPGTREPGPERRTPLAAGHPQGGRCPVRGTEHADDCVGAAPSGVRGGAEERARLQIRPRTPQEGDVRGLRSRGPAPGGGNLGCPHRSSGAPRRPRSPQLGRGGRCPGRSHPRSRREQAQLRPPGVSDRLGRQGRAS